MKCPPYLVSLRVADGERTRCRLWLPIFILWPLLLALLVLTLAATLLADLFTLFVWRRPGYSRFLLGVLGVIGETRGTEVFIEDRSHQSRTVALTLR